MATVKLYLDARSAGEEKPAPVKISLSLHGKTCLHSTGVKVLPSCWDAKQCKIIKGPEKAGLNVLLSSLVSRWEMELMKMGEDGEARKARSVGDLKKRLLRRLGGEEAGQEGEFYSRFVRFSRTRRSEGSRDAYRQTLRRMEAFDADLRLRSFEEIDRRWLLDFDAFMARTAPSANARAFHMRNIRAVFNDALDDEAISCYPFRRFKIRREATRKRALSVEQLRLLASYPCEEWQEPYRDLFVLMFLLVGINAADLFNAPPSALSGGRLEYVRSKTRKPYSILVEPEAAALIEKYRGRRHLLRFLDTVGNYKHYLQRMDRALKTIGPLERRGRGGKKVREPLFPELSQYWSRHTWATVAASLDIPKETIARALGHGGNTVTDIYIDFDMKKVDEANRRVIDWVFYGKK